MRKSFAKNNFIKLNDNIKIPCYNGGFVFLHKFNNYDFFFEVIITFSDFNHHAYQLCGRYVNEGNRLILFDRCI